jgi:uncharacterized coiled-coil protein SlyX
MSEELRRLAGSITPGNVLTVLVMLVSLIAWGVRLEARVDRMEHRVAEQQRQIAYLESARERTVTDAAQTRESLVTVRAQIEGLYQLLQRIERAIERNRNHPYPP